MDLEVSVAKTADGARVQMAGEFDVRTAGTLRAEVMRAAVEGAPSVVLDMAEVTFIDSSGLGTLVGLKRDLGAAGTRLVLEQVPRKVMRILQLTRMDSHFLDDVEPSDAG